MRRGQQFVHYLLKRLRRIVVEEIICFFRRRRQADQVEIDTANQGARIGRFVRGHPVRFEFRENESVNVVPDPGVVLHRRKRRFLDRLESPMVFAVAAVFARDRRGRTRGPRVGRAHFDPGNEVADLRLRKLLALRWHLQVGIGVTDSLNQTTLFRCAGNDHRTILATLFPSALPVEFEATFDLALGRAVTFVAILREDRPNLVLEEVKLGFGRLTSLDRNHRAREYGDSQGLTQGCVRPQTPNPKLQKSSKSQYANLLCQPTFWSLDHWNFFGAWNLVFAVFHTSTH